MYGKQAQVDIHHPFFSTLTECTLLQAEIVELVLRGANLGKAEDIFLPVTSDWFKFYPTLMLQKLT